MESTAPDGFPRPIATVDLCIFALGETGLDLLLTRRGTAPFAGDWSLPGGFVHVDEDASLDAAAARVLREKTGLVAPFVEQLQSFGGAGRDPRGWSLSVAYMALVPADQLPAAGGNSAEAAWHGVAGQGVAMPLAFDHAEILAAALGRLRSKVEYSTLPAHLLPAAFTLSELQSVYERLLGRPLEKSAFRKRMAEADFVEPIEGEMRRASNRPAQLYRLKQAGRTTLFDRLI